MARLSNQQLSTAMLAAVRQHAATIQEMGDRVQFNAWWRGGDGLKVAIWPDRAAWADIKTGESGGAADFARVALGCGLADMLHRYGGLAPVSRGGQHQVPAESTPAPAVAEPIPEDTGWLPGAAWDVWEAHVAELYWCGGCAACVDGEGVCPRVAQLQPVQDWLWERRGIPPQSGILPSGLCPVRPELFPAGPPRDWVERSVRALGRAFLVPLRDQVNRVDGLVLRFPDQTDPAKKTLNVKGLRRAVTQGPVAFGWPGAVARADLVLVVEGAPDTWAAETLGPPNAVVIGANGIGQLPRWVDHLSARRLPTILIPQLDPQHHDPRVSRLSQRVTCEVAEQLAGHGVPVTVFRWESFLSDLDVLGVDITSVKDISDACRFSKAARLEFGFLRDLFWAAARPAQQQKATGAA